MSLSQQKITIGLAAKGTPDNQGVSGKCTIGNRNIEDNTFEGDRLRQYPLMTILAPLKIVSAAISNVATLTLGTGAVAQTTGSPLINGLNAAWTGVDFEGDVLATLTKLGGIRIRTKSTNTGTVTVAGSTSGVVPAITLSADTDLAVAFAVAGKTASGTVTFTFSAASDEVWVEYLAL